MVDTRQPTLGAISFNCPHCGALAHQSWFQCYTKTASKPPAVEDISFLYMRLATLGAEKRNEEIANFSKKTAGFVSLGIEHQSTEKRYSLQNLYLLRCYSCKEFAVWLYDKVIFPRNSVGLAPSQDMPAEVALDFREAASIVDASPRGAAALLRLCVQHLRKYLLLTI